MNFKLKMLIKKIDYKYIIIWAIENKRRYIISYLIEGGKFNLDRIEYFNVLMKAIEMNDIISFEGLINIIGKDISTFFVDNFLYNSFKNDCNLLCSIYKIYGKDYLLEIGFNLNGLICFALKIYEEKIASFLLDNKEELIFNPNDEKSYYNIFSEMIKGNYIDLFKSQYSKYKDRVDSVYLLDIAKTYDRVDLFKFILANITEKNIDLSAYSFFMEDNKIQYEI